MPWVRHPKARCEGEGAHNQSPLWGEEGEDGGSATAFLGGLFQPPLRGDAEEDSSFLPGVRENWVSIPSTGDEEEYLDKTTMEERR